MNGKNKKFQNKIINIKRRLNRDDQSKVLIREPVKANTIPFKDIGSNMDFGFHDFESIPMSPLSLG